MTHYSFTLPKLAIMSSRIRMRTLTSPVHFCLNGQGNQPELMSYVLVLLLRKKSPNQSCWNTKRVFFFFPPAKLIYLFNFHPRLPHAYLCQQREQQTKSKSGWEIIVRWFNFGLIFSCRRRLFSVNEMTMLHLSAEVDVTCFDSLSNLLFWIIQPAVGTSCLLIIDFFL